MRRLLACLLLLMSGAFTGCSQSPSPDRSAAEWVLETGGSVGVEAEGKQWQVTADTGLPSHDFRVYSIAWDIYPGDRNTQVTDSELARLAPLSELRDLDLWAADISDDGIALIASLANLRRLQLSETRITDAALDKLKSLTKLSELSLIGTKVSQSAAKRFQQSHPDCKVITQPTR